MNQKYAFDKTKYLTQVKAIIADLADLTNPTDKQVQQVFVKYTKDGKGMFKKSDLNTALIELLNEGKLALTDRQKETVLKNLKMKDVRTISGVTPVTVLTKPFPCPGKCIFCPNDVRMPKSYLSDEPGAQRAARNKFDPYAQTYNRLIAYKAIGHPTDKIELIILGGTWTSYPESYQIWFVKRCFDAMNDFDKDQTETVEITDTMPFEEKLLRDIDGTEITKTYNQIVSLALIPKRKTAIKEIANWEELFNTHTLNEKAKTRCVGLVIETRPDEINEAEVIRIRKLGATKVQIGFQSLNDEVLSLNKRGHNVSVTANAVGLLRKAGFKIHAHWMPNLYGSDPQKDILDYKKIFADPHFMPDEIKIYPCSLIASAELMQYYKKGLWKPYTLEELSTVLKACYKLTPTYCRITRMIRDIGSHDIVTGNKITNLRELVEKELKKENAQINEIRYREIRGEKVKKADLQLQITEYETSVSYEKFLQYVTKENIIAGFLRLSIPKVAKTHFIDDLKDSAIIREIHIYGQSLEIGQKSIDKSQHLGLGKTLIQEAIKISQKYRFKKLAVISSIGTKDYYKKNGFIDTNLYQIIQLTVSS